MKLEITGLKDNNMIVIFNGRITIYENKNEFNKYQHNVTLNTISKEIISHEYYKYNNNGDIVNFNNECIGYDYILSKPYSVDKTTLPKDNRTYEDFIKYIKDNITIDMIFEQVFEI